jgi:hypothetical protein
MADTGIEQLRKLVGIFNRCNESFLDPFTPEQLLKLYAAHVASEWDFYPDQWAARQVREALRGVTPKWREVKGFIVPSYTREKKT